MAAFKRERNRQDIKWGAYRPELSDYEWLAILTEEVGEAADAILKHSHGYSPRPIQTEVIQAGAVCLAWLEHILEAGNETEGE
jgi:NTP pyrophosphatase (non-canonical NTP hydrolase)